MVTPCKAVPRSQAKRYLGKADEFARSARANLDAGRFSSCGLSAVHAGISAADAVTIWRLGSVNAGPDHRQVVALLRTSLDGKLPSKQQQQIVGLLQAKNDVEYSGEPLSPENAKKMCDQAERFVEWSRSILESAAR